MINLLKEKNLMRGSPVEKFLVESISATRQMANKADFGSAYHSCLSHPT